MYQTLIWPAVAGNEAGGLGSALDSQDLKRSADALVDGMRGDFELGRDFLGRQVLADELQANELPRAQLSDAARDQRIHFGRIVRFRHGVAH